MFLRRVCVCFCHMGSICPLHKACTREPSALGKSPQESACQCRRRRFDPWVRKTPGEGKGNPLQPSCLGNPTDQGAWRTTVHGVAKESDMTVRLHNKNNCYISCPGSMGCLSHHAPGPSLTCIHSPASSVAQSCLTPCHPKDCSTPGLPVHHQLPELAQTHVHQVGDAMQPSHPLWAPFPPTFYLSQHHSFQ